MSLPSVAVVILNFNGQDYLRQFLPAAIRYSPEARIVVADNGSTDDSCRVVREEFPTVELVHWETNYGFAEGYNQALARVKADLYVLLNSDVEVTANWLPPLIALVQMPGVAVCQPKVRAHARPETFEYAGAAGGLLDRWGYPFCRGRIINQVEIDQGQYDQVREIFWATGAAFMIRSDLFHSIGGFDGSFFAHAEEIDLCWRLKRAGWRVAVAPASTVFHVGGGTLNYNTAGKLFLNIRNTLTSNLKNEPGFQRYTLTIWRLILDGLAIAMFLSKLQFKHAFAIIRAHIDFYRRLNKTRQRRQYEGELIEKTRIGPSRASEGRYRGSIVWQFYALGRRKYARLRPLPNLSNISQKK